MQHDPKSYLWDALTAADAVSSFTNGRTSGDFQNNLLFRSAVERQIEIVGESLSQLSKSDVDLANRIPDISRIIGLRNILIHGYAQVDPQRIWRIVEEDLRVYGKRFRACSTSPDTGGRPRAASTYPDAMRLSYPAPALRSQAMDV